MASPISISDYQPLKHSAGMYPDPDLLARLAETAIKTMPSPQTRRMYRARLRDYLAWCDARLDREKVAEWVDKLRSEGAGSSTINQSMAAVRRLVEEAEIQGYLDSGAATAIRRVGGVPKRGVRAGNWLLAPGVARLLDLPDRANQIGRRDAALLAVLVGCGLRREEAAGLSWEQYREIPEREGGKCLVNVNGKRNKIRTVPVPDWAEREIEAWREAWAEGRETKPGAPMFVSFKPGEEGQRISGAGIDWVIKQYAIALGVPKLRAHDLRRTFAQLMHKADVDLEQIRLLLGHENLETTRQYLGVELELGKGRSGVDRIKLDGEKGEVNHEP